MGKDCTIKTWDETPRQEGALGPLQVGHFLYTRLTLVPLTLPVQKLRVGVRVSVYFTVLMAIFMLLIVASCFGSSSPDLLSGHQFELAKANRA